MTLRAGRLGHNCSQYQCFFEAYQAIITLIGLFCVIVNETGAKIRQVLFVFNYWFLRFFLKNLNAI